MSPKIKQALSLLVSTTVVLAQPSVSVYATGVENVVEESTQLLPQDTEEEILSEEQDTEEEIMPYAAAVNPKEVYTQATKSNSDRSGNGSKSNPYNRFEDALANVEDGGTIIIKNEHGAFINGDEYGQIPLIIDKNITIRSENGSPAELSVRASGFILEADVTFENIKFGFTSSNHDSIFANGHTLRLINCTRGSGTRQIDLFAGSLYDVNTGQLIKGYRYNKSTQPEEVKPTVGSDGKIIIETGGSKTEFGKVFSGSMNGDYTGNATIEINRNSSNSLEIVSIHSSGALETKPNNPFDTVEPEPPTENPERYKVHGTVNITLNDYITDINGEGATEVHTTINPKKRYENFSITDINSLTLGGAEIVPDEITWKNDVPGDITLDSNESILNLSEVHTLIVRNFKSNSPDAILTFATDGSLTIENEITGQAVFQTVGGAVDNSCSGFVNLDHTYITTQPDKGDENTFIFRGGTGSQEFYKFIRLDTGEWVIEAVENLPTRIDKFEFAEKEVDFLIDSEYASIKIPINIETDLEPGSFVIGDIPFDLYIDKRKATPEDFLGSWIDEELNLTLTIDDYTDPLMPVLSIWLNGPIEETEVGEYQIILKSHRYGIQAETILNITSVDSPEEAPEDGKDDNINSPDGGDGDLTPDGGEDDTVPDNEEDSTPEEDDGNTGDDNIPGEDDKEDDDSTEDDDSNHPDNGDDDNTDDDNIPEDGDSPENGEDDPIIPDDGDGEPTIPDSGEDDDNDDSTDNESTPDNGEDEDNKNEEEGEGGKDENDKEENEPTPDDGNDNVGEEDKEETPDKEEDGSTGDDKPTAPDNDDTDSDDVIPDDGDDDNNTDNDNNDSTTPDGGDDNPTIPDDDNDFIPDNGNNGGNDNAPDNNPDNDDNDSDIPESAPEVPSPEEPSEPAPEKPSEPTPEVKPEEPKPENKPNRPGNTGNNVGSGGGSSSGNNSTNTTPETNKPEDKVEDKVEDKPEDKVEDNNNEIITDSTPVVTVTQFKDLNNHWAANDVQFVLDRGLFAGMSESDFGANTSATRGMFVTVLHRLAGLPVGNTSSFADVESDKYYSDAVSWATSLGITSGVNNTEFAPDQEVTREQLIVMLYKYAKAFNINTSQTAETLEDFKDVNNVSSWSKEAMQWAVNEGIIVGNAHNKLSPKGTATRAQVAAIFKRFILLIEQSASL